MRWDLIGKFQVLKKGVCSKATKFFDGSEDFFLDHYPGKPQLPETLMIEMIAQAGGVLVGLGCDFEKEVILAKVDQARFFSPVIPPCTMEVESRITEEREEGAWVSGVVTHRGRPVAEADLLLVRVDGFEENHGSKVVFNDSFLKHYDIYGVAAKSQKSAV